MGGGVIKYDKFLYIYNSNDISNCLNAFGNHDAIAMMSAEIQKKNKMQNVDSVGRGYVVSNCPVLVIYLSCNNIDIL